MRTDVWTIGKDFTFSASHELPAMPEGHQCRRLHGHNYIVTVEISARYLDSRQMVIDFGDLDFVADVIALRWDHRHLNDFLNDPTSEVIAEWFSRYVSAELLVKRRSELKVTATVRETPRTFARYQWESPG